jgi:hypothetical protein
MIQNGRIQESRTVNLDGLSIETVAVRLAEAAEGLDLVTLNIEAEDDYGSLITRQCVTGWRDATPDEIKADRKQRAAVKARQREQAERTLARLKRDNPDLFQ